VEYCPSDIYSTEYLLERHHHRRSDQANSCVQDLKYCSGLKDLKSKACMGIEASKTMVEKVRAGLDQQKTPTSHLAGIVEKEVRLAHGVCWHCPAPLKPDVPVARAVHSHLQPKSRIEPSLK